MLIALVVTIACLPLLVLDVMSGSSTSSATSLPTSSDSSLVSATQSPVADDIVDPSSVEMDSPVTEAPVAVTTTVAPPPTTAVRSVPTTTTTRVVVTAPPVTQSDAEFMACVRWRESHNDYTAADPTGTFLGAYQIYQGGWDSVAESIGRTDLVGVPPNHASPADQDTIAWAMLARSGRSPWGGSCR